MPTGSNEGFRRYTAAIRHMAGGAMPNPAVTMLTLALPHPEALPTFPLETQQMTYEASK